MNDIQKKMIEKFQCPGCMAGSDTTCGKCKLQEDNPGFCCKSHYPATICHPGGKIYLGLPTGFDKVGAILNKEDKAHNIVMFASIREMEERYYDYLNIPVWVMEYEGYLLVRKYIPRLNESVIEIIKGAKKEDIIYTPQVYDVAEFIGDID